MREGRDGYLASRGLRAREAVAGRGSAAKDIPSISRPGTPSRPGTSRTIDLVFDRMRS